VMDKATLAERCSPDFLVEGFKPTAALVDALVKKGIDIEGLIAAVHAAGRSPNVLVECWMDRLDDEAATLAQEQEWLQKGVDYLQALVDRA